MDKNQRDLYKLRLVLLKFDDEGEGDGADKADEAEAVKGAVMKDEDKPV